MNERIINDYWVYKWIIQKIGLQSTKHKSLANYNITNLIKPCLKFSFEMKRVYFCLAIQVFCIVAVSSLGVTVTESVNGTSCKIIQTT